jgi:hypothetical protein
MNTSKDQRALNWALGRGAHFVCVSFWLAALMRVWMISDVAAHGGFSKSARIMGMPAWFESVLWATALSLTFMVGWFAWVWTVRRSPLIFQLGVMCFVFGITAIPANIGRSSDDSSALWWNFFLTCASLFLGWLVIKADRWHSRRSHL